jgi:hypothetical protein
VRPDKLADRIDRRARIGATGRRIVQIVTLAA